MWTIAVCESKFVMYDVDQLLYIYDNGLSDLENAAAAVVVVVVVVVVFVVGYEDR